MGSPNPWLLQHQQWQPTQTVPCADHHYHYQTPAGTADSARAGSYAGLVDGVSMQPGSSTNLSHPHNRYLAYAHESSAEPFSAQVAGESSAPPVPPQHSSVPTFGPSQPPPLYSTIPDAEGYGAHNTFYYPPPDVGQAPAVPDTDAPPLPPMDELPPLPTDEPHPPLPPLPPLDTEPIVDTIPPPPTSNDGKSELVQQVTSEAAEQYSTYGQQGQQQNLNAPEQPFAAEDASQPTAYLQNSSNAYHQHGHSFQHSPYGGDAVASASYGFAPSAFTPAVGQQQLQHPHYGYQGLHTAAYQQHISSQHYGPYQQHPSTQPSYGHGPHTGHYHHHHHPPPTVWYQQGYSDQYPGYSNQAPGMPTWDMHMSTAATAATNGSQASSGSTTAAQTSAQGAPANLVDISTLLRLPGRAKRPKKIMIILRGLPGSGKSYLAKKIREEELAAGGEAPRIHAIDDYFMTEVEKEEADEDAGGTRKGRKRTVSVMEYCYDAKMEGVYLKSLSKAVSRTIEEGRYPFLIVDAPNTRVEDFRELWHLGQAAGFEVYVVRPLLSDPDACHARNTHGRSIEDVRAAAAKWEAAPALYTELDVLPLVQARKGDIREVDMDSSSGSDSEAEDTPAAAATASRWSGEEVLEEGRRKRPRPLSDQDILAGVNEVFGVEVAGGGRSRKHAREADVASSAAHSEPGTSNSKSSLRRDGPATAQRQKRVRWPDEAEPAEGFSIGGRNRQLEEVFVLHNLGPAFDGIDHNSNPHCFADQVKAEHSVEQNAFRAILFGHRGGLKDSTALQDE